MEQIFKGKGRELTPLNKQFLEILASLDEKKGVTSVYIAEKLSLPRTRQQSYMNLARLGRLKKLGLVRSFKNAWYEDEKYWKITDKGRESLRTGFL